MRDRSFAGAVGLACLVQLTMPILSLLLPVWVLRSGAPVWTAGVALAVNTVLVILVQRGWAARLVDARASALSALIAAAAMVAAGLLLAPLPHTDTTAAAVALVTAAVVALTAGEVSGGAAGGRWPCSARTPRSRGANSRRSPWQPAAPAPSAPSSRCP